MIEGFSKALRNGQRVYGTMIVSPSPRWLDYVPQLGLDYVFIDLEHIAIDRQTASWMCRAYAGRGLAPLIRISKPDPNLACMALDGGAAGIVAPYVETAEQVQILRGAVKLRPLKGQRLMNVLSGAEEREPELQKYQAAHNGEHVLVVNIESRPAFENLDDILTVPGLDAVLIGPHDLSISLGIPEQYFDPKFEAIVEEIIEKARAKNVGVGFHTVYLQGIEQEIRWIRKGMNMILHLADLSAFCAKIGDDIKRIKAEVGDHISDQSPENISI
jgi:2-keto-3-deoxy-L-rhamnonate aldolase RhmA